MERKIGIYAFLGLMIGALFGVFIGAANGNTVLGVALGAAGGVFLGWFVAAAAIQIEKGKTEGK